MKKVLFISNIPTPYRNEFYNELGKLTELTVIYEAKGASDQGIRFNWDISKVKNYKAIFLKNGDIEENRINSKVFQYLRKQWNYIFVTNYSYMTEMAALIYLKLHRIPYVMEVDGGILKKENIIKKSVKNFLISGAKSYFSPSKETDEFLLNYGAHLENIIRYPFTSINRKEILKKPLTNNQKKIIRNKLGIIENNVILGVGQLIYRKGWELLISIAKEINAGIYIVGDGNQKAKYEAIIEDKGLSNLHLVGFMSNELTTQYYQAADVFVLPTKKDVWGLVVNEALANGIPVITTQDCGAGVELITDYENGILIPSDDEERLKEAINFILTNPDVKSRMSDCAIETIKSYTIEAMVEKHMDYIYG